MMNFRPITEEESIKVWDKFYDLFDFNPSVSAFPAVKSAMSQLKLDIKDCFSSDFPFNKLEQLALKLFEQVSKPGERLYALDWQHECYDFDPRQAMDRNEFDEWIIPIFPNGEYYIFLTKDFTNIWFGHPWEQTITLIGDNFVKLGRQLKEDFKEIKIPFTQ